MYVKPISTRLLRGMLIPAIRAMPLPLTLLVALVLADHEDPAVPPDDLALLTHRLDRRTYLHDPFRRAFRTALGRALAGGKTDETNARRAAWLPAARRMNIAAPIQAAAAGTRTSCHGVRIRGPSAVIATVNSKCAVSEPSWE